MKNILISATLLVVASSPTFAYELIDLGENIEPKAINNSGVVVGSSNTDQYPATALRWSSGNALEVIDGTSANAVNDNGKIAGSTITGAFILDGNNYRDWDDHGAFGINQSGAVSGYSVGENPFQPRSLPYNPAILNGEIWNVFDIAGIYPRGTKEGVYADRFILNDINDSGYAVGYKYRYGLTGSAAILIDPNITVNDLADVIDLPTPAGGRASDINNNNMIVGTTGSNSGTIPVTYSQAYFLDYNTNSLTILPTLEGGLRSAAYAVNDYNQVVGTSEAMVGTTTVNHAFLWNQADDTLVDLNGWAAEGWILSSATANNDNGDIVGTGTLNGVEHGFLLTFTLPNETLPAPTDSDEDGYPNYQDNCIDKSNPDQTDTDGDGYGNICDADLDNDGAVGFSDFTLFKPLFGFADADADFDGDGAVGFSDFTIFRASFGGAPGPSCCVP